MAQTTKSFVSNNETRTRRMSHGAKADPAVAPGDLEIRPNVANISQ